MIERDKIEELVQEAIREEDAFLVDFSIDAGNRILVVADHPQGISLKKLGSISRKVEHSLDREENDFSLEVSSPGVGSPFKVEEQYAQNVGRPVKIKLQKGREIKGELVEYNGNKLRVTWEEKVPRENGKGKQKVQREEEIELNDIIETRLEIRF